MGSYQQEIDLISLFKDVCSEYVQMCTVPQQLPNLIDRAIRIAVERGSPDVHHRPLGCASSSTYEAPPGHAFKQVPSSLGLAPSATVAPDDAA